MEINSSYTSIPKKEMPGCRGSTANGVIDSYSLQQHIQQIQQHHELQQQLLLEQFQFARQQLSQEQEKQLQELKDFVERQQRKEEEARVENERVEKAAALEALRNKDKSAESAVASNAVKQVLQEFIRKKNEPGINNGGIGSQAYRLGHYDGDNFHALRKTASEPNLKVRAKSRKMLMERSSPMFRHKDRSLLKRRTLSHLIPSTQSSHPLLQVLYQRVVDYSNNFYSIVKEVAGGGSNPDSGPGSPPNGAILPENHTNSNSIQEEGSGNSSFGVLPAGSIPDISASLYSSPSLPNISLGRPPNAQQSTETPKFGNAMDVNSSNIPIAPTLQQHNPPFPPTEGAESTTPVFLQKNVTSPLLSYTNTNPTISNEQQSIGGRHRPLGRTQSAPLPLGHPAFQQGYENMYRDRPPYDNLLVKQHVRQTLLNRAANNKQQVENVMEENEEMPPTDKPEVIDLTEVPAGSRTQTSRDTPKEAFLPQGSFGSRQPAPFQSEGFVSRVAHVIRPLVRANSSPLVSLSPPPSVSPHESPGGKTTAVSFDNLMLKHQCTCGMNQNHPEHSGRLQSIIARLQETGLLSRSQRIRSRKATLEELQSCHSEAYTLLFGTSPLSLQKVDISKLAANLPVNHIIRLPCSGFGVDSDTTWNEHHTPAAARMAVGCVTDLAFKVARGECKNGYAIVRPPGHHAEYQQPMGFCFFNSVAIAAKQLRTHLGLDKILIVDWDVHHGNGTQQMFYNDPHILYMSIHRHDGGNFFPGTGGPSEVGAEDGVGFTVNVAWSGGLNPAMGDTEYLAAFRTIIMPIAKDWDPELVLVSAGFDAARGHPAPLGGYQVSPACFGWMSRQLLQLANGKVILALEGGYDLAAICDTSEECMRVLLGDENTPISNEELRKKPCQNAIDTLKQTISIQSSHWPCINRWADTVSMSALESSTREREESDTVSAMANLSVAHGGSTCGSTSDLSDKDASQHMMGECHEDKEGSEEPMDEDTSSK